MRWRWLMMLLLLTAVAGKGKKHKKQKPGRAVLDRLASTTLSDPFPLPAAEGPLPAPLDVSPYSAVVASATCGDDGVEEYCREMPGKRGIVCSACEGPGGAPARHHPASHAVDGDSATWWQSPTVARSDQHRQVELVATLPAMMELLHVIIKAGPSPRPLAWSLQVSISEAGDDWRLVRAFGDKEHCRKLWDLRPERRKRKARGVKRRDRADKPTCSTQFTSPRPLENGEMHVPTGEGVISRRVRISFLAPHSAAADRQYYTVRALTLAARCLCHRHASECTVDNNGATCACLHGTCGAHCSSCCGGGPWAPGEACAAAGGRGACQYEDGQLLCVNCTENRAGPLCDRCLPGYFSVDPDGPCEPCDCDPDGSDGICTYDRQRRKPLCNCLPSVIGDRCDACLDIAATFPSCDIIDCDSRGVVDSSRTDKACECKANVIGARCDACAPGHFGLDAALPAAPAAAGCKPCYCSGVADHCTEDPDPQADMALPLGEAWRIAELYGNQTLEPALDAMDQPFLINYEVDGWGAYYWATSTFNGSLLSRYGSSVAVELTWGVVRGDAGGSPTEGPDFVIVGADGTKLAHFSGTQHNPGTLHLLAPLVEEAWTPLPLPRAGVGGGGGGGGVDRLALMRVLSDVRELMVRAQFHLDQDEVRLHSASLLATNSAPRELCACPPGHAGAHCASCAWTHVRVRTAAGAECVRCACNGHAGCESVDGPCAPCQHNTTGPHCERCLPGHYGNPVTGGCKPCACPLYSASNNFSPLCAQSSAVDENEYVCTQCADGYAGDRCEKCDYGYFGSPTTLGGSCQRCKCGVSPCDPATGDCLECEGDSCRQCEEGFYWKDVECVPCSCHGDECFSEESPPACRPPCSCGAASLSRACDVTGACACAPGAAPPKCDVCLEEHYGLNATGCEGCNCSPLGSESSNCNIRTGQCRCKPHVTGRTCDTCEEGYHGLTVSGCRRCACGPGAAPCDPLTGACACAPGVTGPHCDVCLSGYYGLGANGCSPCPTCSDGKVCEGVHGRCVCPRGSLGPNCRQCAKGYWARGQRCEPCRCGAGAADSTCDPHTGLCHCRLGWSGRACDACAPGHYGARCRPCACNEAGTERCGDALCPCSEDGRCPCKENVSGARCDTCLAGTFGLSRDSPTGCTACFCFGRSSHCTQAGLTRASIHVAAPKHLTLVLGDEIGAVDQDSLISVHTRAPDATIAVPSPPTPVYFELDPRFLGDRVTSYAGALRWRLEEEGGVELPADVRGRFPLVRVYGRNNLVMDYFERVPAINGTYSVRFHETLWRVRTPPAAHPSRSPPSPPLDAPLHASRGAMMVLLQDVRRILVRANTRAVRRGENVHALLLNVSMESTAPGEGRSSPAGGVELCACPRGYSASSCQQPAPGFWMPPDQLTWTAVHGTIVINLEGEVKPCECNNRATVCHPVTGDCLNCTAGTGGARCDTCAAGHHGAPEAPGGCQPCPCPHRTRNYADACVVARGALQCLCSEGYAGAQCELCAPSYTRSRDGGCVTCACDALGARSPACDERGRCECRHFATGTKCDQCREERTFMEGEGCVPCDNCTQTLLDSIEQLSSDLRIRADLNDLSKIPKPYHALHQYTHNSTRLRTQMHQLRQQKTSNNLDGDVEDLSSSVQRVLETAEAQKEQAVLNEKSASWLSEEGMAGLEDVLSKRREIGELVSQLDEFAQGERHLSAHRALKEARRLLKHMRELRLLDRLGAANDVWDKARLQSQTIRHYLAPLNVTGHQLSTLRTRLSDWLRRIEDVPLLVEAVWRAREGVNKGGREVKPRLSAVRELGERCREAMEDITSLSPSNFTNPTLTSIHQAQLLTRDFPALTSSLQTLTLAAEEKEGILYSLTPGYKNKYLNAVQKHVAQLGRKADAYKNLFAGTLSLASGGMSAAHGWADVTSLVQAAGQLAASAGAAAASARAAVRGAGARRGGQEVARLRGRGEAVLQRAQELRTHLSHLHRSAERVGVALRGLGWQERDLAARPQASVTQVLRTANSQSDRVFGTTRVLYEEASELRRRVQYHLRRQLGELSKHGDTALGAAQEHVSQIRGATLRASSLAGALSDAAASRAREHASADANLTPLLDSLRTSTARARHHANSISVSIMSAPDAAYGCARVYRITSTSPSVTRLSLAVSFDDHVRDGTLLYLPNEQDSKSYMKLEVEDRRFKLTWDMGDGPAVLFHPDVLEATHADSDHNSYRIDIERVWSTCRLTVSHAASPPHSAAGNLSSPRAALPASRLRLGGAGEGAEALPGCVHAVYYDERRLGLWNFLEQPKEAKCSGCSQRLFNSARNTEPSLVWFSGSGYVQLRRSGLRPSDRRMFSLTLVFRTRDEHALLFMARDIVNNRSISVTMQSCRVVFRVEYASSALQITAGGDHCHGRAVHVQAVRVFDHTKLEQGSLRVNGDETLGAPSPPVQSPAALPDLTAAPYWLGGAPPGETGVAPPLLGCLGALTVDRVGYDLLETTMRNGVEPRCGVRTFRSATLEGSGYIDLPSPTFRRKAALGVSFRARAPAGLLLYRAPALPRANDNEVEDEDSVDVDENHYLALLLVDGFLELVAAAGKSPLRLRVNGTRLDDGAMHTVRVVRLHKQLELWLDGSVAARGTLPGNALPARSRGLYVGGVPAPARAHAAPLKLPLAGWTGTVADLIVDGIVIGLETAVEWRGARLGRADADTREETRAEPRALQAQPPAAGECTKSASYAVEAGAVKFGDAPHSHASLRLPARLARQLSVELQFRTFRQDGLLIVVPGSRSKPRHYLSLSLREGRLRGVLRGRRRHALALPLPPAARGAWRQISIRITSSRIELSCDGSAVTSRAPRKVGLGARLYVGGLPDRAAVPGLPDAVWAVPGLVGCVRRVRLAARAQDLTQHHRVAQCAPSVEPAAHYSGDAYAMWSSSWSRTNSELGGSLRLEFRTATGGVLLAANSFVLEHRAGALILTRRSATGEEISRVETRGPGERSLCDDRWHAIVARVSSAVVSMSVDGGPELRGSGPGLLDEATDAPVDSEPLYIGGIPEGIIDSVGGGRDNFKGCIRDVVIAGETRDWTKMESLHNVLLDACPVAQ